MGNTQATPAPRDPVAAIADLLAASDGFWISTHIFPDGDAVASELAMWHVLRKLGKRAFIVNHSIASEMYRFLPGFDQVHSLCEGAHGDPASHAELDPRPQTLIALDCGRRFRLGDVPDVLGPSRVINIDHHLSNDFFGDLNLVRPEACSTGELVLELAVACGAELDLEIATCVYAAIVSDTGRFSYANTNARAHEIAARMIEVGVDPAEISHRLWRSRSMGQLRLHSALVNRLELADGGRVAHVTLDQALCDEVDVDPVDTLDAVHVPISVRGVDVGILFRVEGDEVKVSLRSEGAVDVSALAARFGGGGHQGAAGCALRAPADAARAQVLAAVSEAVAASPLDP